MTERHFHLFVVCAILGGAAYWTTTELVTWGKNRGYIEQRSFQQALEDGEHKANLKIALEKLRYIEQQLEKKEEIKQAPPCSLCQTCCCGPTCGCRNCDCCPGCPGAHYSRNAWCGCSNCTCCKGCEGKPNAHRPHPCHKGGCCK